MVRVVVFIAALATLCQTLAASIALDRRQTIPLSGTRFYGGGLTILAYNDLDNNPKNGSAAVLIHQPAEYAETTFSCELLGESFWNPDTANFTDGLNSSLSYQIYLKIFPADQKFWIAKVNNQTDSCRAIDASGNITDTDCTELLPSLCTQSAPVSTMDTNDTPTDFLVDQPVGSQVYTGFRDHFVWKFRGVRYAAQPQRFDYSTVFEANESGIIPALKAGADCLQPIGEVQNGSSEDCLFMNIWTPYLPALNGSSAPPAPLRPVMFYIFGGGFTSGSSKNPNTDGTMLASRGDVVSIQINYRVSTVGFLAFDDGVHNGNYGLQDIITALHWVKEHIADFGGDPDKITIFGESAGAMLVRALLASPAAEGLFYAAISQSGPSGLGAAYYDSLAHYYNTTTIPILNATGCLNATDQLGCMRNYSAWDMINLPRVANSLIVDGTYLVSNTLALNNTSGYTKDVVYMTGTNRDELGVDVNMPAAGANVTDIYAHGLPDGIGNFARLVNSPELGVSQNASQEDVLKAVIRISTDAMYTCGEEATAFSASKHGVFKGLYSFMFNRTYNPTGYTKPWCDAPKTAAMPNGDPNEWYARCHGGEQIIVFGTERRDSLPDRDGLDVPFMQLIIDYWSSFARTRDPNPDIDYLTARGYWNTISQIQEVGAWIEEKDYPFPRLLQWDGGQMSLREMPQCEALDIPLDYFETSH